MPLERTVMFFSLPHTCPMFSLLQEEKHKAYRREKKKNKRKAGEAGLDNDMDPDMAAVMGFSGFGGAKK